MSQAGQGAHTHTARLNFHGLGHDHIYENIFRLTDSQPWNAPANAASVLAEQNSRRSLADLLVTASPALCAVDTCCFKTSKVTATSMLSAAMAADSCSISGIPVPGLASPQPAALPEGAAVHASLLTTVTACFASRQASVEQWRQPVFASWHLPSSADRTQPLSAAQHSASLELTVASACFLPWNSSRTQLPGPAESAAPKSAWWQGCTVRIAHQATRGAQATPMSPRVGRLPCCGDDGRRLSLACL